MSLRSAASLCVALGGLLAQPVAAQAPTAVATLSTAVSEGAPPELGPSLDRALRPPLEDAPSLELRGEAALDLAEVQLALGCEGDGAECLGAVASELGVTQLLVPTLRREGDDLVLEGRVFDAPTGQDAARAERRAPLTSAGQLLDAAEGLVHELFGIEPEVTPPPPDDRLPTQNPEGPPPEDRGVFMGVAGGTLAVGAIAFGVGVGVGVLSEDTERRYAEHPLANENDAAGALGLLREAEAQALAANLLLSIGGTFALGGLAWLIAEAVQ